MDIILYSSNPQNTIIQTELKHYKQFRSIRTKALRWLQITIYRVNKTKVENEAKERDHKILNFITIELIKFEH